VSPSPRPCWLQPRQTVPFALDAPYGEKALVVKIYDTEVEYPLTFVKVPSFAPSSYRVH